MSTTTDRDILPRGFFSAFAVEVEDLETELGCSPGDLDDHIAAVGGEVVDGTITVEVAARAEAEYRIGKAHQELPGKYHAAATALINLAVEWKIAREMERTAARRAKTEMVLAAELGIPETVIADLAGVDRVTVRRALGK